ncbi:MAG: glycoside hydrolase family 78 protein [candidate division KSB1 bacterium]|nr:glycoside hydrolase family 78 protein [candidate division KSB1 bacterium]MDZ7301779.1 glycoside hydrolase family 78 protein [candidate division KSB1 bacterium]MDZ7311442.1 glycoside hydrolase family 78 protein [candidate division KSB1 bacterium]
MLEKAHWIWLAQEKNLPNSFLRFRRTFRVETHRNATLHITASARYNAYVNGHYLGQGPPRAWPQHYQYDLYDLTPYLQEGENVLAILVHHFGIGNMQWIPAPPGLWAQIQLQSPESIDIIGTDTSWRVMPEPAFLRPTPRISIQMGFEEQYDARLTEAGWKDLHFDDRNWKNASIVADPVQNLRPRDISFLTARPLPPVRVLNIEAVRPVQQVWSMNLRPYFNPEDNSAHFLRTHAFLFTQIHVPDTTTATFTRIHARDSRVKLNGHEIPAQALEENCYFNFFRHELLLQKGWNSLLIDYRQAEHLTRFVATLDAPLPLRLAWKGPEGDGPWALLGPFDDPLARTHELATFPFHNVPTITLQPGATQEKANDLWQAGKPDASLLSSNLAIAIRPEDIAVDDITARAYSDVALHDHRVKIENLEALLACEGNWATIHPPACHGDVRILLDFGKEGVGHFTLEIDAAEGTTIDLVGFENRRNDGKLDWTEGTNNSLRYIGSKGRSSYRSFGRRGLRFAYLYVRNFSQPVRLRKIALVESIHPQQYRGHFVCSDAKLSAIWEVGARTMACCSEDTYVDCPAYEQVHWVGDARNEALVDWVVNGDARLWRHCLLQSAYSLERSPLVESHVPSAWPIILPAWSFLWMRSCREYFWHTGDRQGAEELWPWIVRQIDGIKKFLNQDGLFEICAWNMFDWAPMETPDHGVVTHQNCLLTLALQEIAELAEWLDKKTEAKSYRALADQLHRAINQQLYDSERQAYVDARYPDGRLGKTLSQQTQSVALVSQVAKDDRAQKARADMLAPPAGYVRAGSPFFKFFLLEALIREENTLAVLTEIRDKWGFMIDHGATTFWEMWSGPKGRLTRSYCHGWSAAPTFFLSTYVLGVQPLTPGFARTRIAPHPGDLRWAQGSVPTPKGEIHVAWENPEAGEFTLKVKAPRDIEIEVVPPKINTNIKLEKQ